jgi:hypothetical protein
MSATLYAIYLDSHDHGSVINGLFTSEKLACDAALLCGVNLKNLEKSTHSPLGNKIVRINDDGEIDENGEEIEYEQDDNLTHRLLDGFYDGSSMDGDSVEPSIVEHTISTKVNDFAYCFCENSGNRREDMMKVFSSLDEAIAYVKKEYDMDMTIVDKSMDDTDKFQLSGHSMTHENGRTVAEYDGHDYYCINRMPINTLWSVDFNRD